MILFLVIILALKNYKNESVKEKVDKWISTVEKLSEVGKDKRQSALCCLYQISAVSIDLLSTGTVGSIIRMMEILFKKIVVYWL